MTPLAVDGGQFASLPCSNLSSHRLKVPLHAVNANREAVEQEPLRVFYDHRSEHTWTMSPNSLDPISRDLGLELELQQPFGIASENHFALCAGEVNLIEKLYRAIIAHSKTVITAHHHALRAHLFDYEFHNRFRMRDRVIGKPLEIGTRSLGQVL